MVFLPQTNPICFRELCRGFGGGSVSASFVGLEVKVFFRFNGDFERLKRARPRIFPLGIDYFGESAMLCVPIM